MSTPTSQPDPFTVWQFRFLICRDRNAGQQMVTISGAKRRRTQFDAFHGCQSYLCEDYAEYELLQRTVVGKTEKSFWGVVELYDSATGERRKIDDTLRFTLTSQAGQAAKSPGSLPIVAELRRDMTDAYAAEVGAGIETALSQTPGGSQSGGVVVEAAPCEPKGTLSDPPATDADAGTPESTASLEDGTSSSPAPEPVSARAPASKKGRPKPKK